MMNGMCGIEKILYSIETNAVVNLQQERKKLTRRKRRKRENMEKKGEHGD